MGILTATLAILAVGFCGLAYLGYRRQMHMWFGAYVVESLKGGLENASAPIEVFVCIADHYEPGWGNPGIEVERHRVETWCRRFPELAARHRDADGKPPQYTFFYPAEEYREEHLDQLAGLCHAGYGAVEVHLHHDNDTAEGLRRTLNEFKQTLHERHGLLTRNPTSGEIEYAFIHGNWTLDNCARNGRLCGVNNELQVLRETGCYVDMTLPSAPSETQTRKINSIYYATDDPDRPKSHDDGVDVEVGREPSGDLMLIQGPLALNWQSRKWGFLPRTENGELSGDNPPTPQRADCWIRQHVHVKGRPDWVFVKLHTHGAQEQNFEALLGEPMDRMLTHLENAYNDGKRFRLHYVTAREMYDCVKLAESGGRLDLRVTPPRPTSEVVG